FGDGVGRILLLEAIALLARYKSYFHDQTGLCILLAFNRGLDLVLVEHGIVLRICFGRADQSTIRPDFIGRNLRLLRRGGRDREHKSSDQKRNGIARAHGGPHRPINATTPNLFLAWIPTL